MIIIKQINKTSELGSDIVGGTGPSTSLVESSAISAGEKVGIQAIGQLLMLGINPIALGVTFVATILLPVAMSYFGPSKRVYTTEDLQIMFNDIKAQYQSQYLAYTKSKQILPTTSNENLYPNVYQNLLPTATNIDFSKYDINKNVWKLSGFNGWNGLGYKKSKYMMYSGFGIYFTKN